MRRKILTVVLGMLAVTSVFPRVIPFEEIEEVVCKVFANDMAHFSVMATFERLAFLKMNHTVPPEADSLLIALCSECEVRKITRNYIDEDSMERLKKKMTIDSIYQNLIDTCLMRYDEKTAGAMIKITLRLADGLKIGSQVQEKVKQLGLEVAHERRRNPCHKEDAQVMSGLKKLLTRPQLMEIINAKNARPAAERSKAVWEELRDSGYVSAADSAKEYGKMIHYYIAEMGINDLYVDNDDMRMRNLTDLWGRQPVFVRKYESIRRRKETMRMKTTIEGNQMVW